VSLNDLAKLFRELEEKTQESVDIQMSGWSKQPNQTDEQFAAIKADARRAAKLMVVMIGAKGEQIVDYSADALTAADVPDTIQTVTFDSSAAYTYRFGAAHQLLNRFKLVLDFSEPPLKGGYNAWQQSTPSNTAFELIGPNKTWVTAVRATVTSFFEERRRRRKWLHNNITFAALNWLIGFPIAIWLLVRFNSSMDAWLGDLHSAIKGTIYVYIFLAFALVFRVIIHGLRWAFPIAELEGARSLRVRALILAGPGALLIFLLYSGLYDAVKAMLGTILGLSH